MLASLFLKTSLLHLTFAVDYFSPHLSDLERQCGKWNYTSALTIFSFLFL